MAAQTVHIVSCAYNSLMLSEIGVPDWDMFHSSHPFAWMHASARAISGGPLYVSDSPGNHDQLILKSLVFPDGNILRTLTPARPTEDCLFTNPMLDGKTALKIWSRNLVNGVVGVFNTQGSSWDRKSRRYTQNDNDMKSVTAQVTAYDIADEAFLNPVKSIGQSDSFVAWSYQEKEIKYLKSRYTSFDVNLDYKQSDVISISPLFYVNRTTSARRSGKLRNVLETGKRLFRRSNNLPNAAPDIVHFSAIGLVDMLNGGASVRQVECFSGNRIRVVAVGVGKFLVYLSAIPNQVFINGINLHDFKCSKLSEGLFSHLVHFADDAYLLELMLPNTSHSLDPKNILFQW
jgi:raffinose synthase